MKYLIRERQVVVGAIILSTLLALPMPAALGQFEVSDRLSNRPDRYEAAVLVLVSCENASVSDLAKSYLKRELRSLGDVEVRDSIAPWVVQAIIVETKTEGGAVLGYSMGISLQRSLNVDMLSLFLSGCEGASEEISRYSQLMGQIWEISAFWVFVGDRDDLQNLCKKAIALFDTQQLEPERVLYHGLKKPLDEE